MSSCREATFQTISWMRARSSPDIFMGLLDPPPAEEGSILTGVLLSLGCQIILFFPIVLLMFGVRVHLPEFFVVWIWMGLLWGFTQWALVWPISRHLKGSYLPRARKGLLRSSLAGMILNILFLLLVSLLAAGGAGMIA